MLQKLKDQVSRIYSILKTVWSWLRTKAEALRVCFDNARSGMCAWYGERKREIKRKRHKRQERKQRSYLYGHAGLALECVGLRIKGIVAYSLILPLGALIGEATKLDLYLPTPILCVVGFLLLAIAFRQFKFKLDQYYILRNHSVVRALIVTFITFSVPTLLFLVVNCWPSPLLDTSFASTSPDVLGETTVLTNTTRGITPISFEWGLGDGTAASGENVTHTYAMTGIFQVFLVASNSIATDTFSDTVEIFAPGTTPVRLPRPLRSINLGESLLMKSVRWSLATLFFSSSLMALVQGTTISLPGLPDAQFLRILGAVKTHLRAVCGGDGLVWSEKKPNPEIEQRLQWVQAATNGIEELLKPLATDRPLHRFLVALSKDLEKLEEALYISLRFGGQWRRYFSAQRPDDLNDVEIERRESIERLRCNKLL